MIATEYIYSPSNAQDLAQQFADKLAGMIGWSSGTESNGASVKREGLALYFKFEVSSTNIFLKIYNASTSSYNSQVPYNSSYLYGITAFVSAGGTIAVGISYGEKANQSITPKNLNVAIAQTQGGEYVGIIPQPGSTATYNLYFIPENATYKEYYPNVFFNIYTYNNSETVIRQMPYMWGATMFKDLYEIVISSAHSDSDNLHPSFNSTKLFANGTYYRIFGHNITSFGVAIADIT